MKIGIQTFGSRGDVLPWIAIADGLSKAGHDVSFFYTSYIDAKFSHFSNDKLEIRSTREFFPEKEVYSKIPKKKLYLLNSDELCDYIFVDIINLFEEEILLAANEICENNDLIITHPNCYHVATLAEKNNVPRIIMMPEHLFTPYNSNTKMEDMDEGVNKYFLKSFNELRHKYQLSPVLNARTEVFCSKLLNILIYSKVFHFKNEEWDHLYKCTGFLEITNNKESVISDELKKFLDDGDAPIFFSVGSLAFFEGEESDIIDIFLRSIQLSGCRAIIQGKWDDCNNELLKSENIFLVDYIQYSSIFPLCAGAVHHGGAGTTHATLKYGCPSITIAYAWDQFYWGNELVRLGCSPVLLKRRSVDHIQLAGAISCLLKDYDYKIKADGIRRKMKRENGVSKTVKLIEEFIDIHFLKAEPSQMAI